MVALAFLIRVSLMLPPPKIWLWTNWSDLQPFFCYVRHYMQSPADMKFRNLLYSLSLWCAVLHSMLACWSVPINPSEKEKLKKKFLAPVAVTYVLWVAIGSQPWASPFPSFETLFSWGLDSSHSSDAHLCYAPSSCITVWIIFVINTF